MLKNINNRRSGVVNFLLIRASAWIILSYVLMWSIFFCYHTQITYDNWLSFNSLVIVRIFTLLTTIAIVVHAKIGLWQVITDYIKVASIRHGLNFIINIVLLSYVILGLFLVLEV